MKKCIICNQEIEEDRDVCDDCINEQLNKTEVNKHGKPTRTK